VSAVTLGTDSHTFLGVELIGSRLKVDDAGAFLRVFIGPDVSTVSLGTNSHAFLGVKLVCS
ncbi:hypothetical protein, partial [Campylobacter jejuni]|uniref:hypothetical protein n=1 Tax=Campylobacter jejuni TaxID=197 RepID=UPI001E466CB9